MTKRSAFHLDSMPIIPSCGFNCGKRIEEMKSVFGGVAGVSGFYREGDGVVVEQDAGVVTGGTGLMAVSDEFVDYAVEQLSAKQRLYKTVGRHIKRSGGEQHNMENSL